MSAASSNPRNTSLGPLSGTSRHTEWRSQLGGLLKKHRWVAGSLLVGALIVATSSTATTVNLNGPGSASKQADYVGFLPLESGQALDMVLRRNWMYLLTRTSLAIYDTTTPSTPELTSRLPLSYRPRPELKLSPDGRTAWIVELGGDDALHIYNVADKTAPKERSSLPNLRDSEIWCVLRCKWVYGSAGTIFDMRRPARPNVRVRAASRRNWKRQVAGVNFNVSDIREIRPGFLVDAPSQGLFQDVRLRFHYIDARRPLHPKLIATSKRSRLRRSFGAARWPRRGRDRILLMSTSWAGETLSCTDDNQGPLVTYDAARYRRTRRFAPLDEHLVAMGNYTDGNPPATSSVGCNTGGFEEHPAFRNRGLVVLAHYDHGTRFVRVSRRGRLREVGYYLPFSGQTDEAEWVRRGDRARIVYALDRSSGVYILRFTGRLR